MRILTIHNKYKSRGGEDESRESEDQLLLSRGHEVRELIFDNAELRTRWREVRAGLQTAWASKSYEKVRTAVTAWRPDIVDIHNFFPLASPSVHYAARSVGVPVVQTLHNFRLLCPGATFCRDGRVCEDCSRLNLPWPAMVHGCYQNSPVRSSAVVLMIGAHRLIRTWERVVSLYVAVSEFTKQKFVENGFEERKIIVKPNFVSNAGQMDSGGEDLLYVGRLSREKGLLTLMRAMESPAVGCLNIIGEGPLSEQVQAVAARNPRIRYLGRQEKGTVLRRMGQSKCVVVPSECYETFGRVAAEAFSRGTPVIASRIGALQELVSDGRTGFHFTPGDPNDLARIIGEVNANPERLREMRVQCRKEYEVKYTPERNYELLMTTYETAIANS